MTTQHRPTTTLAVDVFGDHATPIEVAADAWLTVRRWVDEDYLPVITVTMPDGSTHDVDLEQQVTPEGPA